MTNGAKINAYIYGRQAFAKLFEQPSYILYKLNVRVFSIAYVHFYMCMCLNNANKEEDITCIV